MQRIAEWIGHELKWVQPSLKMEFELRAGDMPVASLRFKSAFGSFATAESAEGCWTFKRAGFLHTRVTIRQCGAETEMATFRNNTWDSGGTLELPDGGKFPANTNFWQTHYDFRTPAGETLFTYRNIGGVLHASALVEIQPPAADVAELPWMVILGWYLVLMMRSDSGSAAAVT